MRGVVSFGGQDITGDLSNLTYSVFKNETTDNVVWDPINLVTAANGENVWTPVVNSGAIAPPA
jgi:hypothetical protein